ncbi:hypothetical protein MXB_4090 [Myxobolus squamalis]|nr:hypothetical protein MXB_4090 [Myxobolus squamalis]
MLELLYERSLVDDNMVDTDKIGTSIYFWAFPSKAIIARKNQIDKLTAESDEIIKKIKESQRILDQSKIGKEESPERTELVEVHEKLSSRHEELKTELGKYSECNPKVFEEITKHCEELRL